MKRSIISVLTIALVLAILVTAFLPSSVAVATQYGSKDTSDSDTFWYLGANHLNVGAMKESISKWVAGADKANPVVIGVIDTGLNHTHEVFQKTGTLYKVDGKVQGYNAFVASSASDVKNPTESQLAEVADTTTNTHGTAVASIIAMLIYEVGLQDYIKIYPIKASRNDTLAFPDASVAEALNFIGRTRDSIGIDVANIAICGYNSSHYTQHQGLFLTTSSNTVIVSAAGNDGYASATKAGYPASLDGVLSVMGYGKNGAKTQNSNFGNYDVTAPADDIYAAKGATDSYTTIDGTSAATAFVSFVSAVVALREQTAGSGVNGTIIARHVATSSTKNHINYGNYTLPKFEGYDAVNNPISETYLEPTGITLNNDKNLSSGAVIYRGQNGAITFSADLTPYGNVNPALESQIVWTRTEILTKPIVDQDGKETGEVEEYNGQTTEIGRGKTVSYTPDVKGTYVIKASYSNGETVIEQGFRYTLKYVAYDTVAGIVQVTPIESNFDKEGTIFVGEGLSFVLSNGEGLDPFVETKWYVNGQYAGAGKTFSFAPSKGGEYVITAQYGDYRMVENVFTLTVKSAFFRTEIWASVTGVGALLVAGAVVTAVLVSKKKRAQKA